MSRTALVYGLPVSAEASRLTEKLTAKLLEHGIEAAGFINIDYANPGSVAAQYRSLLDTDADALILLATWQDNPQSLPIAEMALSLGKSLLEFDEKRGLRDLDHFDLLTPFTPGMGVIAPDSDPNERPHEEAARIVLGARGAYYDSPLRNLGRTAQIWGGILGAKLRDDATITAEDVALCMVGLKLSRESFRHKRDNITDSHGYLIALDMIREERAANENTTTEATE